MNGNKFLRTLTICFLILCSLSLIVSAQFKKDRSRARELQDQAAKEFTQKNYRGAVDKYNQAIVLVPTNPEAHYWKAASHYYLKEYEPAKYEFQLALNQGYKPLLDIYRIRWFMFYDQKDYDAALGDLNKGLQIEPRNVDFLTGVGEIYAARNQFTEALAAYQKGIEMKALCRAILDALYVLLMLKLETPVEQLRGELPIDELNQYNRDALQTMSAGL